MSYRPTTAGEVSETRQSIVFIVLLGVAGITAMIGVLSTALLISVLAQKLELSRAENYVHNFVLNMKIAKERKHQAANVIKSVLKLWYLRRKQSSTSIEYIKAQRELVRSIHTSQQLKTAQKNLADSCIGLPELYVMQNDTNVRARENTQTLATMRVKIEKIEEQLGNMSYAVTNIQSTLHLLLDKNKSSERIHAC